MRHLRPRAIIQWLRTVPARRKRYGTCTRMTIRRDSSRWGGLAHVFCVCRSFPNIGNTNALSTQSALYPAVEQGGLGLSGAGVEDFGRGSAVLNGGARGDLPPISAVGSSAALRAVAASCRDRVLLAWRAFAATTAPRARVGRVVPEDSGPGAAHPSCRSGRGWPEWPPAPRRWPRCVPSRHSARMSPRRCRTPA